MKTNKRVAVISVFLALCMAFVSYTIYASDTQPSDYDLYYPQFVDSKEPLSVLEKKDWDMRTNAINTRPVLSAIPSKDRTDYFDISYGPDPMQKLDIHHKKGNQKRPVIFFIHGGGWVMGDKDFSRFVVPTWVDLGYTVVSINYRLAPSSTHPAQIEDCAMALKWVINNIKNYGGNPNQIALTGHSAGAQLTALLVTDEKLHKKYGINIKNVKCWFPLSGIYDFNLPENYYHPSLDGYNNAYLGTNANNKYAASAINYVDGNEPPSLILHGGDDWLVPKTNSINLYNKLKRKGADSTLSIVKGYWHSHILMCFGEAGHKPTYIVNKFLAKHLPTSQNNPGDY
jgi:acetyl esterase/lipase